MIEEEEMPLSDNKITQILNEQNINIARRTVTKYRESLNIPTSALRKIAQYV
jgi:RNA polymerase sigma-54 factor